MPFIFMGHITLFSLSDFSIFCFWLKKGAMQCQIMKPTMTRVRPESCNQVGTSTDGESGSLVGWFFLWMILPVYLSIFKQYKLSSICSYFETKISHVFVIKFQLQKTINNKTVWRRSHTKENSTEYLLYSTRFVCKI